MNRTQDPALYAGQNQDPGVTSAQGRLVFHQERLFRSTGGGQKAHAIYIALAAKAGLPVLITEMARAQVITALQLIELACRYAGLANFRDIRTQWETL